MTLGMRMMLEPADKGGSPVEAERKAEVSHLLPGSRTALRTRTSRWTGWTCVGSGTPGKGARELIAGNHTCAIRRVVPGSVVKPPTMPANTPEGDGTISRVERGGDKPRVPRLLSVFDVLTESDKSDSSDECESDHSNC